MSHYRLSISNGIPYKEAREDSDSSDADDEFDTEEFEVRVFR